MLYKKYTIKQNNYYACTMFLCRNCTHPSLLSLREISSAFLFVSTNIRLLFSFSPMISSRSLESLNNKQNINFNNDNSNNIHENCHEVGRIMFKPFFYFTTNNFFTFRPSDKQLKKILTHYILKLVQDEFSQSIF